MRCGNEVCESEMRKWGVIMGEVRKWGVKMGSNMRQWGVRVR